MELALASILSAVVWLRLRRILPAQNVAAIFALLVAGEWLADGATRDGDSVAQALCWAAALLLAREAGAWILGRWRENRNYGFWRIGIAAAAAAVLRGGPWGELGARFGCDVVLLIAATPWFVRKERLAVESAGG